MIDEPTPPLTGDRLTLTVREIRLLADTVCLFAGRDDGYPALRMVHFEPYGDGTRVVATDSYALAWYDGIQTDLGGVSVNIEAKTLRTTAKHVRHLSSDDSVTFVRVDGFWAADKLPIKRLADPFAVEYPPTAAFIDAWQPETHCDSVRLGYTLNVLNKVYEINDTPIEFSFGSDALKPVSFSFVWGKDEATEIRGVCMTTKPTTK